MEKDAYNVYYNAIKLIDIKSSKEIINKDLFSLYENTNTIIVDDRSDLFNIYNNNFVIHLINSKTLGKGGFGTVFEYTQLDSDYKQLNHAYKYSIKQGDIDNDIKIIELLGDKSCDVIKSKILHDEKTDEKYILMERMDGDLFNHVKNDLNILSLNNTLVLFKYLLKASFCLFEKDIYHVDIKLSNVLYKKKEDNSYEFVLGDLGGAYCHNNTKDCTTSEISYTYPSYLRWNNEESMFISTGEPTINDILYGIGFLIINLHPNDMKIRLWNYWASNPEENIKIWLDDLKIPLKFKKLVSRCIFSGNADKKYFKKLISDIEKIINH